MTRIQSPDETDLRRQLAEANQMFRAVLDAIPVRVFWKDSDSVYLGCNTLFARDAGFEHPEQLVGHDDHYMGWKEQAELYRSDDRAVIASGEAKLAYEEPQTTPDGARIWLRTSKIPLRDAAGAIIGVLGTYEDITAYKLLQEQGLHREKLGALGRLAGGIAHDFNNLLTAIVGSLELARMSQPQPAVRTRIDAAQSAAERAAALTKQMLAFARRQAVEPVTLDAAEAVERLENMLTPMLGERIALGIASTPPLPTIRIDPGQFEQLLVNLAVNARDAMPNGGDLRNELEARLIDAADKALFPELEPGPHLQLCVSDTGSGMDPQTMAHIFEPFFTTKGSGQGVGLGLATCHGIVSQNRGALRVDSTAGKGTVFTILFPGSSAPAGDVARPLPPVQEEPGAETVLVVEDESRVRDMCCDALRAMGYHVLSAATGAQALEAARAFPGEIHLLLSDVVLPDISGPEVAEQLQKERPKMCVLFVSGYAESAGAHGGALRDGVNFVAKPYTPAQINRAIRRILTDQLAASVLPPGRKK